MTSLVRTERMGRLGRIVLDRPKAINALNGEMIEAVARQLHDWQNDDAVALVCFEGEGERGFCAGGDVRAVREMVLRQNLHEAEAFFAGEYRLNAQIAAYPKPTVGLAHGVVMGGGIGIFAHCRFRVLAGPVRLAMPEAAIGFFPDVGAQFLLRHASKARALLFLMSGMAVGPADAIALGLADAWIGETGRGGMRAALQTVARQGQQTGTALAALLQAHGAQPPDPPMLCALADRMGAAFEGQTLEAIMEAVARLADADPQLAAASGLIAQRSPASLSVIVDAFEAARAHPDLNAVLRTDLVLARAMIRHPDFVEGVRAVLVDKTAPVWSGAPAPSF